VQTEEAKMINTPSVTEIAIMGFTLAEIPRVIKF